MKKQILFLLILSFLASISLKAQLEMNSSGEVGIGATPVVGNALFTTTAKINHLGVNWSPISGIDFCTPKAQITCLGINSSPSTTYKLNLEGDANFKANSALVSLIFTNCGMWETELRPSMNNSNTIGSSSYAFRAMYSYAYPTLSDKRQKENIQNIAGALSKILLLQGVKYDIKEEFAYDRDLITDEEFINKLDQERKDQLGFLAQDVDKVLPEVVVYDDSTDIYAIEYSRIIPVLVEAIKEQQLQIEELQTALESSGDLKGAAVSFSDSQIPETSSSDIFQNAPNPFTKETIIRYSLDESVESATLFIYDMNGKQLSSYNLHDRGESEINIVGGELDPGMYMYSLVADGLLIGTKQMLLTD